MEELEKFKEGAPLSSIYFKIKQSEVHWNSTASSVTSVSGLELLKKEPNFAGRTLCINQYVHSALSQIAPTHYDPSSKLSLNFKRTSKWVKCLTAMQC